MRRLCADPRLASVLESLSIDALELAGTMLLHDVGKHFERQLLPGPCAATGQGYAFCGHESRGAAWLAERGSGEAFAQRVRDHAAIRQHASAEQIWQDVARHDRRRLVELMFVYVADQLGKGATPAQLQSFERERPKLVTLCGFAGLDPRAFFDVIEEIRRGLAPTGDLGGAG
jgi:hypothetical protein